MLRSEKGARNKLEKAFEAVWLNRSSPINKLVESIWEDYCKMQSTEMGKIPLALKPARNEKDLVPPIQYIKKPRRLNRNEGNTTAGRKQGTVKLSDCRTVGDMFANVHQLALPCRSMSMLKTPHTFYLIWLNPNATEMKERLSFTLYHTLHNEFFAQSCTKGTRYKT